RRIRAVLADIVVESLTATVKLDNSTSLDVKASLDQNVGQTFGKDSSLGLTYSKAGDGTYKIQTLSPVIVAVQVGKQPKNGTLEADESAPWPADTKLKLKTDQP
ncbi:MAG: hypothetical protein JWQ87_5522, partial [Candidatus Sulfotelmatobacter sp.]|nr:hypothetical protein [Candidatus Sulfotelmatobacter sp.]